jgi:oxygen-independent coproporphyrinogen III oxidase
LSHVSTKGEMPIYFCNMSSPVIISPVLISKYNRPVPRYTSYPTVPFWNNEISRQQWRQQFRDAFIARNQADGISLYIHLPFCESLCTYCGCNKKITTNHAVEEAYMEALLKEWSLYIQQMGERPILREIHLGGGTPTFFSPAHLAGLLEAIIATAIIHPEAQFSLEGHPNNTTRQHLDQLFQLGFRRISYGVQDLDPRVQHIINRIQPFEKVQQASEEARAAGFTAVNFDLIYGLPLQTHSSIEQTINQVVTLRPDRIAFYSYAHVPWTSRGQRLFSEADLPGAADKLGLYLLGQNLLTTAGYADIGMDHFALPQDELFKAKAGGYLHRNFMGYTTQHSGLLLGLGVSAISDLNSAFAQNNKTVHEYYGAVNNGDLAIMRGYLLNEEDLAFRQYIKEIACNGATRFAPDHLPVLKELSFPILEELAEDGLLEFDQEGMQLTVIGHYFIRNACSAFDLHLQRSRSSHASPLFSKAI